jgi:tRNA(Arg) A34 adenosine deaminase TadA/SAM-dependent methyltransferase
VGISEDDLRHLRRAVDLAREGLAAGDEPFGSVLVDETGRERYADHNRVSGGDQTRHPELAIALWAVRHLTPEERAAATVYTSGEHCAMCAAAHAWVGLGRIVYAGSTAQLVEWRAEAGVVAAPPVAPLSINEVAPGVPVDGPAEEFAEELRGMHQELLRRPAAPGAEAGQRPGHGHEHGLPADPDAFWEEFYTLEDGPWSGRPNPLLVDELTGHPGADVPGSALDLGCGAGADAIWLAEQGWAVTGVDLSTAALEQALAAALAAGVADRIRWLRLDLTTGVAEGTWDLVTASYLHSPVGLPREEVLRRAAGAVAPGGTLLVLGHQGAPSWEAAPPDLGFPTADDVLAALDLDGWTVERAEPVTVRLTAPDGAPGSRVDNIVRLRRDPDATTP